MQELTSISQMNNSIAAFVVGKCNVYTVLVCDVIIDKKLLTEEENYRAEKFHRKEDKERYLATRCYIREILASVTGINKFNIEFGKSESGKPFLKNDENTFFSISHTNQRIAIAVCKENECGCDIEEIDPSQVSDDIINNHFHPNEIAYISKHDKAERFYYCWTRKEALFKATGKGLPDNLSQTDTTKSHQLISREYYLIDTIKFDNGHILSIAYKTK